MPVVKVEVRWQKEAFKEVEVDLESPPSVLKMQLYSLTGVPPERQKVSCVRREKGRAVMGGGGGWTPEAVGGGATVHRPSSPPPPPPTHTTQIMGVKGGLLKDDGDWVALGLKEGQRLTMMGTADKAPEAPAAAQTFVEDLPEEEQDTTGGWVGSLVGWWRRAWWWRGGRRAPAHPPTHPSTPPLARHVKVRRWA